jgi:PHP family Zn ribbon phosphoesterase
MSNIKLSKSEAQKKVYELTEKLLHTKKDFKDVSAGYKERIKELESEIKAVVEDAGGLPLSADVVEPAE